jgi:hypothetical protein
MLINPNIIFSRIALTSVICMMLGVFSSDVLSWEYEGHTAIGVLAVGQLPPATVRELESFINPLTKQAMAEACNWPDDIRETEEGEWSTPLHYVNIPRSDAVYSGPRDCPAHTEHPVSAERPAQYCLTESIKHFAAGLADEQASQEQRWQAFAWLCHLVGDLHQPLHAGFADDRGGNNVEVVFNDEPMNLHHFWDSALIEQRAGSWQFLVGELSEFPPVQADAGWSPGMVDDWTNESHKLAIQRSYPPTHIIDEDFAQQSWVVVQQQIRLASSRLAWIINTELSPAN